MPLPSHSKSTPKQSIRKNNTHKTISIYWPMILIALISMFAIYLCESSYDKYNHLTNLTFDMMNECSHIVMSMGKITFFQKDGIILGDPQWNINQTNPISRTYHYLETPAVSLDTWNRISSTTLDNSSMYNFTDNGENWSVVTVHPQLFNGEYYMSMFLKTNDVMYIEQEMHLKHDELYDYCKA
jgi:hypothetical protein